MSLATDILKAKEIRDQLYELERRISKQAQMRPITPADENLMRGMQARADAVFNELGRRAPAFLPMERPDEYRRRLLEPLKACSPQWRNADLDRVADDALNVIEQQIFDAARADAKAPHDLKQGEFREIVKTGEGGHKETIFVGRDTHFVQQFSRPARRVRLRSWDDYMALSRRA